MQDAESRGIGITSCSDLFLSEMRANHPRTKVIGISGSKGKSTSVSMLFHILKSAGCHAALGGNIGKPLIELIDGNYDYIVGEFSSYQASDLSASPHIVMFTNLFPCIRIGITAMKTIAGIKFIWRRTSRRETAAGSAIGTSSSKLIPGI